MLQAKAELEKRRRARLRLPISDFVAALSPGWLPPTHLAPLVELLERARTEGRVFGVVNVPPRHFKTETVLHTVARWLGLHPSETIAFVTYASDLARSKSRIGRDYARKAGVRLRGDMGSLSEWRTSDGGGFLATGIGGPLTGQGCRLLIVDDPHKNRVEAESKRIRDTAWEWLTSTGLSRLTPDGSCVIVHTRWHEDDLGGRAIEDGWFHCNLPAINERGEALCPEGGWTVDVLDERRRKVGEYDWASLYMGQPRPRGDQLFRDAVLYDEPPEHFRVVIGADFAYTAKTSSDYSVAVVLAESGGLYYVLDVLRGQWAAPEFQARLQALQADYGGAKTVAYIGGVERGTVDLFGASGVPIIGRPAVADKFVRAQATSAAWNDEKILVPRNAPWLAEFINELKLFTGIRDQHDDQVDALVAAYDELNKPVKDYDGLRRGRPSSRSARGRSRR